MPLYINVPLSFLIAVLWVGRLRSRAHLFSHFLSWPLVSGMLFQTIVLTPIQSFHFRFHYDWALGYLVDPDLHPALDQYLPLWALIAALLPIGAAFLGHVLARIPVEKPKSRAYGVALGASIVTLCLGGALAWPQLVAIGTYEEFILGEGHFLWSTPTGIVGIVQVAFSAAFVAYGPRVLDIIPKESSNLT